LGEKVGVKWLITPSYLKLSFPSPPPPPFRLPFSLLLPFLLHSLPPFLAHAGICHDFENAPRIAKLLYYESSRLPAGESTSFDEYISRCDPEQVGRKGGRKGIDRSPASYGKVPHSSCSTSFIPSFSPLSQNAIYFLCAPNRELAEASPYYEAFKRSNKEVRIHPPLALPPSLPSLRAFHPGQALTLLLLFLVIQVIFVYNAIDDFVMNNLKTYHGRDFKTAEATGLDLGPDKKMGEEDGELNGRGAGRRRKGGGLG
jgi:hypothetical protein